MTVILRRKRNVMISSSLLPGRMMNAELRTYNVTDFWSREQFALEYRLLFNAKSQKQDVSARV